MSVTLVIAGVFAAWLLLGFVVGVAVGTMIRKRDQQIPIDTWGGNSVRKQGEGRAEGSFRAR